MILTVDVSQVKIESERVRKVWMNPAVQRTISKGIGVELQRSVADYVLTDSYSRHKSADRIGGKHTGFRADAAKQVARRSALSFDSKGGSLELPRAPFARAFRDVTIRPGPGKRLLTIPLTAQTYGVRAMKGASFRFKKAFWKELNGKMFLVQSAGKGKLLFLYLGLEEVHQKKDRSLLPTDEAMSQAAQYGAEQAISLLIQQANQKGQS